ncbi:unnamed protein product [Spirodela intermedia]|uniref:Uncharacterized protein n=1 Tax=Spirodela intermedia TaxID=51605 RepID=A0A7I8ITZ2_SPIIN|nr:unnamed protein product [Spirodela intermedia]CAA6661356.1 unnamed protein product [Spirodela intermedia]
MEKTSDEIYSLYENLSENSRDQASFELYDRDKKRGIHELHHDNDSKFRNEGPASGSEAQSGVAASRAQVAWLGLIGARVHHSSSTSLVASQLWARSGRTCKRRDLRKGYGANLRGCIA